MANTVKIMIRAKVGSKYPYLAAALSSNGRLKPGVAILGGQEVKVDGTYCLRFTEAGKRRFVPVGTDPTLAAAAAKKQEALLQAWAYGLVASPVEEKTDSRPTLADAIAAYKAEIKEHKAPKTYVGYAFALDLFTKVCPKTFVDEVNRGCMMKFIAAIKNGRSEYTVHKLTCYLYTFLLRHGKQGILARNDWPKFEKNKKHKIYSDRDVEKMLAVCENVRERAAILFPANSGFRKGEISHAERSDVDFDARTVKTGSKPHLNWTTKDHEERTVPADSLMQILGQLVASNPPGTTLLFPAKNGGVDLHLDRVVMGIAKRAGVTIPKKPMHAFRALYATRLVRSGTDVYTIQKLLGHSEIETTLGYLRAVENSDPTLREQAKAAAF